MKILLALESYFPAVNGVATSVASLRKGLVARGHDVRIMTLSQTKETREEDGVTYVGSMDCSFIYPDIRLRHMIKRSVIQSLIDWKPDIIHTNTEFSTFFLSKTIAARACCPMIHTYHTDYEDYVTYIHLGKKLGAELVKGYVRHVTKCSEVVISPTRKTERELMRYGIADKVRVIPTGIDLTRFRKETSEERKSELRRKHGIAEDKSVVMFLGRLGKEKNLSETISYLSHSLDLPFQFVVVGDGPARKDYEREAEESGLGDRTVFVGKVAPSEVPDYYSLASLFTSASVSETQGLTYIEALASGVPLLCRKDDCLEGVAENGVNGWTYETEEEFRERLSSFLSDPSLSLSLSQNARSGAEEFSQEKFAEKVEDLYLSVISNYRPKAVPRAKIAWRKVFSRIPII